MDPAVAADAGKEREESEYTRVEVELQCLKEMIFHELAKDDRPPLSWGYYLLFAYIVAVLLWLLPQWNQPTVAIDGLLASCGSLVGLFVGMKREYQRAVGAVRRGASLYDEGIRHIPVGGGTSPYEMSVTAIARE